MIVSGVASSVWAEKTSAIIMQGHGLGGMVIDTAWGGLCTQSADPFCASSP
jgi:hypothetical protein